MKTINSKFLFYVVLAVIFCLSQSCGGVYNSTNLTIERALEINHPVKIKTTEGTDIGLLSWRGMIRAFMVLSGRNQMLQENIRKK